MYLVAYYWFDEHQALFVSIAANLISIPVIFMLYEYWQVFNHRKLNKSLFEYAANEMTLMMAEIKGQLEPMMLGLRYYCQGLPLVIDDSDTRCIEIGLYESSIQELKRCLENGCSNLDDDDGFYEDFYSFDVSIISPMLSDQLFIGFQIHAFDLSAVIRRVERLIENSFVMERMTDTQSRIIVELHQQLIALNSFILYADDLYLKLAAQIIGMSVKVNKDPTLNGFVGSLMLEVHHDDEDFSTVLDEKLFDSRYLQDLGSLYLINPDRLHVYGDLLVALTHRLNEWRSQHAVFVDHANTRIGIL